MTVRELIAYRREAEQYLGTDDHLYRVHWVRSFRSFDHEETEKRKERMGSIFNFRAGGPASRDTAAADPADTLRAGGRE